MLTGCRCRERRGTRRGLREFGLEGRVEVSRRAVDRVTFRLVSSRRSGKTRGREGGGRPYMISLLACPGSLDRSARTWPCPQGSCTSPNPSFRPGESSSSSTCSNWGALPVRALLACTRWAFDSGTSQSGRVVGTSWYSCPPAPSKPRQPGWSRCHLEGANCSERREPTPLRRSNITRMATQNSSKSQLPSLSTSARSHTRSSWSSRRPLFFSTGAACSPVRYWPPFVRAEKMFQ